MSSQKVKKQTPSEQQVLKDVRRAYLLAKALNVQYMFIREYLNPELVKAINNAKAGNSYFIKQIEASFIKRNFKHLLDVDEELSFNLLEQLEKLDNDKQDIHTG
jgi:hypothetical protein